MSLHLRERAEAAVGRSNTVFSEAAAAPFVPHGYHSHIPEVLSSVTLSTIADSVQRLNGRVSKVENMVLSLEATIMRGVNKGPATGGSGYGGLFQTNSVSDMHEAVHDALAPVRDTLRQHERLIADVVTAMNSLDAWKVAASAASLPRASQSHTVRESKKTASKPVESGAESGAPSSTTTFLDAEARLQRLRKLATSISELPTIPLVPPSHYAGHAKKRGGGDANVVTDDPASAVKSTTSRDDQAVNMVTMNTSAGFGNMGDVDSDTNTSMSSTSPYNAVHDMSDTTHGGGFRTLVDVTDASATESDAQRGPGGGHNLMNRVQRILGGDTSAGDLTADERGLLAETSSNSEAYRELIGRMQMGHPDSTPPMTTTSSE